MKLKIEGSRQRDALDLPSVAASAVFATACLAAWIALLAAGVWLGMLATSVTPGLLGYAFWAALAFCLHQVALAMYQTARARLRAS